MWLGIGRGEEGREDCLDCLEWWLLWFNLFVGDGFLFVKQFLDLFYYLEEGCAFAVLSRSATL